MNSNQAPKLPIHLVQCIVNYTSQSKQLEITSQIKNRMLTIDIARRSHRALITIEDSPSIRLFDLDSLKELAKVKNGEFNQGNYNIIKLENTLFAACRFDNVISIFDSLNGMTLHKTINLKITSYIRKIIWVSGPLIALGDSKGDVMILNHESECILATLQGHSNLISCMLVLGTNLITCAYDGNILFWDLADLDFHKERRIDCVCVLNAHLGFVFDMALIKKRLCYSAGSDYFLKKWDFVERRYINMMRQNWPIEKLCVICERFLLFKEMTHYHLWCTEKDLVVKQIKLSFLPNMGLCIHYYFHKVQDKLDLEHFVDYLNCKENLTSNEDSEVSISGFMRSISHKINGFIETIVFR